ncbi:hypothetical protein NP493_383g00017 [Ridgeia piscesae]|uniref:Transmembrane protein n=1 Tax=Ridgeia piscesae TaxID=27915 RepID=A0AAD9L368_RIDPI|nr:hypothetical protein NP493_383g00017 [Ridgeia piscesae]
MDRYVTSRDIRDDDDESVKQDQCCLRATHLCLGATTLLLLSAALLIASVWIEQLVDLKRPLYAILFLAIVIVMATGTVAMTVEWRIREKLCGREQNSAATCWNRRRQSKEGEHQCVSYVGVAEIDNTQS